MTKRLSLLFLASASPVVLLCFFFDRATFQWLFAILAVGFPFALVILATSSSKRHGGLIAPLTLVAIICHASMFAMLVLSGVNDRVWLGLPSSAYFLLLGLWIFPLGITGWAYANTFEILGVDEAVLTQIQERRRSSNDLDRN